MKYPLHKQIHARVQPFPVVCPRVLANSWKRFIRHRFISFKIKAKEMVMPLIIKNYVSMEETATACVPRQG